MNEDLNNPKVLIRVANDFEASAIVTALKELGIDAKAVGGFTAGFVAEAPGDVKIMVREGELKAAQKALEQIEINSEEVDWSKVDVGEPRRIGSRTHTFSGGAGCQRTFALAPDSLRCLEVATQNEQFSFASKLLQHSSVIVSRGVFGELPNAPFIVATIVSIVFQDRNAIGENCGYFFAQFA